MAQPAVRRSAQDVIQLLRAQGVRMTPQRIAIVREVLSISGYAIPTEVIDRVQAQVPGVSPSTVYRTLERLEEIGVLTHVHLEGGLGYHRVEDERHAHLSCSGCGAVEELSQASLQRLERAVARLGDFRPDLTHHAIAGLCARCQAVASGS